MTELSLKQYALMAANAVRDSKKRVMGESRVLVCWSMFVLCLCLAAQISGILSMVVEKEAIVYVAFIFPIFVAPYVFLQRVRLNKLPKIVYVINGIRAEANRLTFINNRLTVERNRLENEVTRLKGAEQRLQKLANESGSNVNRIVELVKENSKVQKKMKELQKSEELVQLFAAIMASDTNQDYIISDAEVDLLLLRMSLLSAADAAKIREMFLKADLSQKFSASELFKVVN